MNVSRFVRYGAVWVLCGVLTASVAWANGEEFFGERDTVLDTYFFGHVTDTEGKVLDNVVVTVVAKNINMKFPFRNDAPGHFRSPDIGKAVKGLGKTLDASQLEITIAKRGYVLAQPIRIPSKLEGGVGPIDFVMKAAPARTN